MTTSVPDDLDFDDFSSAVVQLSQLGKTALCEIERGPSDTTPVLIWQGFGLDDTHVISFNKLTLRTLTEAFAKHGTPRYLAIIVEAFTKVAKDLDEIQAIQHGELQHDFRHRFDANVKEVICVMSFDLKGDISASTTGFTYDDEGMPVFNESEVPNVMFNGAMIEVVNEFVKFLDPTAGDWRLR